jgi:hypothetical protein
VTRAAPPPPPVPHCLAHKASFGGANIHRAEDRRAPTTRRQTKSVAPLRASLSGVSQSLQELRNNCL